MNDNVWHGLELYIMRSTRLIVKALAMRLWRDTMFVSEDMVLMGDFDL